MGEWEMRLESCMHFDTEMFIKQIKIWEKEKERLIQELEAISELPSVNKNEVRGTDISDPTSRLALKRLEIQEHISDIEECEAVYEFAKASLTPEELEIFQLFFDPKEPIWKAIDKYTQKKYTCRMNVYRERRRILEKLDRLIAKKYNMW